MRTGRIGFHVVTIALVSAFVSSCTRRASSPPSDPAAAHEKSPDEPVTPDLAAQVATFADESCACEDRACADAVAAEFNDWAEAHADAEGSSAASNEIAAQVARMAACADRFTSELPVQGQPCTEAGECAEGLECLRYRGIAGDKGPTFTSCEIPCAGGQACPDGMKCRTIADGPGQVCRP